MVSNIRMFINKSTFIFIFLLFSGCFTANSQNTDAVVLHYRTYCEVSDNKLQQTDSVSIQINNRLGDTYTKISLPYSKENRLSDLSAWIEDMKGNKIRELKKSEIHDKSAIADFSLYEDDFIKYFELRHNEYPYRIVYTYTLSSRSFIMISAWNPVINEKIPTLDGRLKVQLPRGFAYNKLEKNIESFRSDSTETALILEWKAKYLKPLPEELFSRPVDYLPAVEIAPHHFQYGIEGSLTDWKSYGNWQYDLMQGLDVLPKAEQDKINSLISGITDKKEIVRILYHYLQDNTRYINVSIGIGGFKPYPASYVAQNKYGDCKALSNYMKAMLAFAGIQSYYTNVYASALFYPSVDSFPGPQFNHIILAVPIDNDTLWLENTSTSFPFNYLGSATQNRKGLLIEKDKSRLVIIPPLRPEATLNSKNMNFTMSTKGNGKVQINQSFRGIFFDVFDNLHTDFNESEKDQIIRKYVPFDNYEVIDWELKKPHRDSAFIVLSTTLNLYKILHPIADEYYFDLYPVTIPPFTNAASRKLPVELPFPFFDADTLSYQLPEGFEVKTALQSIHLSSIYGQFTSEASIHEGKLRIIRSFLLYPLHCSLSDYPAFYDFLQEVKNAGPKKIVIRPVQ
ncbi:MAG: DUF3857 domain-containing protein [Bacteroidales bacterium]